MSDQPHTLSSPALPQPDYAHKWWVLLSVAMGVFLSTIDGSIVTIALPTLEKEFDTALATVQWVTISYLLVLTSLMLGIARWGDMIGKKRIYRSGIAIFTLGSVLCGVAPTIGLLIAFRVVQGLGAVMIQALGMGIVTEAFPREERGRALGLIGTIVSVGISVGPVLGGLLIGTVGWRAIFLVNVPVGLLGLALVQRFIPDWRPPDGQRFDLAGAVIMLFSLLALALGLTLGPDAGWTTPHILALLIGAGVGLCVFVGIEQRLEQPMIDLTLFRDRVFSINLLNGFMVFIVIGGLFILTFYLERVQGYNTRQTGLFMTVIPAALGLSAPLSGLLADRYGTRGISLIGLIVTALGCVAIATLKENTSTLGYILRLLPLGLGVGLFQSPNNSAIMGAASRTQLGAVSGLLSLSRTFGQVTGVPLMSAIFASRVLAITDLEAGLDATDAPAWAIVQGLETEFLAGAGLISVGVVLAAYVWNVSRKRHVVPAT